MVDERNNQNNEPDQYYRHDPQRKYQRKNFREDPYSQDEIRTGTTQRSTFLNDIETSMTKMDDYEKKLKRINNNYEEVLNDQADMIASLSKARTLSDQNAYKQQLKDATSFSNQYLKMMKNTYRLSAKNMNSEDAVQYKKKIMDAEKNAREVIKVAKKLDTDFGRQLEKGSTATTIGKLTDLIASAGKAYTNFNVNQFVTGATRESQSYIDSRDTLGKQNAMTISETKQLSKTIRDQVANELGNSFKSSDIISYAPQAGQLVGGNNVKEIAELTKTLKERDQLGLGTNVDSYVTAARTAGLDVNSYVEQMTNMQATAARTKGSNGKQLKINQSDLNSQMGSIQSGLASVIDNPENIQNVNKQLMSVMGSLQNSSPQSANTVSKIIENAIADPTDGSKLGINNQSILKALNSGDVDSIMSSIYNAADKVGGMTGRQANTLKGTLGLSAEDVSSFKNINRNKSDINQNIGILGNSLDNPKDATKLASSSENNRGGNVISKTLRPVFEKAASLGETVADWMGTDMSDVNSQLTTVINLLSAIAASDLVSKGKDLFFSGTKGSTLVQSIKSIATKTGAGTAVKSAGSAMGGTLTSLGGGSLLQGIGKVAGPAAIVLSVFEGVAGALNAEKILGTSEGRTTEGKIASGIGTMLGGTVNNGKGGLLSGLAGGAKGAAIGTMIAPGIGTAIGAVVGGVFGLIGGDKLAEISNKYVVKPVSKFFKKLGKTVDSINTDTKDKIEKKTNKITNTGETVAERDARYKKEAKNNNDITNFGMVSSWFKDSKKNSHKNGLDTVPYDEYPATLHKDEAVLTAEQANTWREQQRGASATSFLSDTIKNAEFTPESKTLNRAGGKESKDDKSSSNVGELSGEVPEQVWKGLKKLGFTPYGIAGIMGNMKHESGMNPGISEIGGGTTSAGAGFGLVQWTPASKLDDYIKAKGTGERTSVSTQLNFLADQLKGTSPVHNDTGAYAGLMAATSPQQAAETFVRLYERPAAWALAQTLSGRQTSAKEYYDTYSKYEQGTPWVPDTQVALVHKGEAIIPEKHNPFDKNGNVEGVATTGNSQLDADLKNLLTWGFNKVVEAIVSDKTIDPLSIPNFPTNVPTIRK